MSSRAARRREGRLARRRRCSIALTAVVFAVAMLAAVGSAAAATAVAHATAVGPAGRSQPLELVIPLVADDAGLSRFALAVSTPGSPVYGEYQSISTLAQRFGASPTAQAKVVHYLRSIGATQVQASPTGMFVQATMSVALAERTFATPLASFQTGPGRRFIAPATVAHAGSAATRLPSALSGLALGVVGLDTRPLLPLPVSSARARPQARATAVQPPSDYGPASGTPSGCRGAVQSGGFTPNQYLTAYGYQPLRNAGLGGQGERVAVIEIDRFKNSDLATFAHCFGLHVPSITTYTPGSRSALPLGEESTLDLEVLDAAAPDLKSLEVFESNGDAAQVDQSFVAPLVAPGAKPQVISASLGLCEPDMQQAFGRSGILTVERGLQLAAATGISVLASSGDNGSAECVNDQGVPYDELAANYPASSAWVTAVGGTNLLLNRANQLQSEVVWNDTTDQIGAGGGGFSGLFARPSYQSGVVAQPSRAVPDVSMLADVAPGYAIYCTANGVQGCGGWTTVGGTSAATPLLAGGIALVNQDLYRHRRELTGFLNPLLYGLGTGSSQAQVFHDVTSIGNDLGPYLPGGNHQPLGCCGAAPGFDEASGWGSLNLANFDAMALALLPKFGDVSLSVARRQRPVKQHKVWIRLSCTESCTAFAFGFVTIRGWHHFLLHSGSYSFPGTGTRRTAIGFTRRQEQWLRSALRANRTIYAELFGAALDARHQVAKVTAAQLLRITS